VNESLNRTVFLRELESRLAKGAQEYGNKSFNRSFRDLTEEVLQEYLDIAGWAYVGWAKAKERLEIIEAQMAKVQLRNGECVDDCC
jgi:hypothetical protein